MLQKVSGKLLPAVVYLQLVFEDRVENTEQEQQQKVSQFNKRTVAGGRA